MQHKPKLSQSELVALDHSHVWHPFTPMRQWRETKPLFIAAGDGAELIDTEGKRYLDGVSSLWCNVHGHCVKAIDDAIRDQLSRIAHTTLLGLSHEPAARLAGKLCEIAPGALNKVFYSDAGATALEVAFKMAIGHFYHSGQPERQLFIALDGAYHGDTAGAMSVGYSELFHRPFRPLTFHTEFVPPDNLPALAAKLAEHGPKVAGVVIEPLVQGAAGMLMQSPGYLTGVQQLVREHGTLLIADEVATGFGRTGRLFACDHEAIEPDILCLGKGLTGGYMPLAATLCTDPIEQSFTGELHAFRTLFHGHTFTGNPLACAAALASIDLFETTDLMQRVQGRTEQLNAGLTELAKSPHVLDARHRGLMAGVELRGAAEGEHGGGTTLGDFGESRDRYAKRTGYRVCELARERGLIIRPLGDVLVLMPPLCISEAQLKQMLELVGQCIELACNPTT